MNHLYITDSAEHYHAERYPPESKKLRTPEMTLEIQVYTYIDGKHKEELEDGIKAFMKGYGVVAKIYSSTGNEMTVNPFYRKK